MTPGGSSSPLERRSILSRKCSSRARTISSSSRELLRDCPRRLRPGSRPSTCAGPRRAASSSSSAPFCEEDLALVVDELAGRRLADRDASSDLAEERVAEDLRLPRRACVSRRSALVIFDVLARARPSPCPCGEKMRALMTMPPTPGGTRASCRGRRRPSRRRSRGAASLRGRAGVSPFGVILPTRMSPGFTSAPMRTMPASSRSLRASSPTFGMSRGDLFLAELRVAGDALELLDVDRGEDVVLGDALGDEDRVLEVVALPRHERDEHVLAERELAHVACADRRRGRRPPSRARPARTIGFWL